MKIWILCLIVYAVTVIEGLIIYNSTQELIFTTAEEKKININLTRRPNTILMWIPLVNIIFTILCLTITKENVEEFLYYFFSNPS
jgi:hypothetical protein